MNKKKLLVILSLVAILIIALNARITKTDENLTVSFDRFAKRRKKCKVNETPDMIDNVEIIDFTSKVKNFDETTEK